MTQRVPRRVAVRASGRFNVTTAAGTVQGLHHRWFRLLQRSDGYRYGMGAVLSTVQAA